MSNLKSYICVMFLFAFLGGCSGKNTLMPTPHLYTIGGKSLFDELAPEFKSNRIEVMYATDRLPEKDESGNLNYSYHRSSSLAYGLATVELGENLSWDELVTYSTQKTDMSSPVVDLISIKEHGRFPATPYLYHEAGKYDSLAIDPEIIAERKQIMAQARADLLQQLSRTSHKEVFVFVHGINYTFEEAVEVVAEGSYFFGRQGVSIAYTWPAGNPGLFNYAYDRESGEFTIFHLKNFIKFLSSVQEVEKIHFIAHSRGTDVLMSALREIWIEIRSSDIDPREHFRIGNVVLIAPDLDFEVTMQRLVADYVGSLFERLTIYSNIKDEALGAAKILFSSLTRVGAMQQATLTEQQRDLLERISNMDVVSYQGSTGGHFGHSYFLSNPAVSSDIIALLRYGWAPGKENGRPLEHLGGKFWRIDDAYPLMNDK